MGLIVNCTLCDDASCIPQECGALNPIDIFVQFPVRTGQRSCLNIIFVLVTERVVIFVIFSSIGGTRQCGGQVG